MRFADLAIWMLACGSAVTASGMTFGEAVALLAKKSTSDSELVASELSVLRRSRLPSVRAEVTTNASRTLDLFAEGPYEVRYGTSTLAFDYPLWDGGALGLRTAAVEARLRRVQARGGVSDAQFMALLETFGSLYLAQHETEILAPLVEELSVEAARNAALLERGEISNLTAAERDDVALLLESQLFEASARRTELATRFRLLTGMETEPRLELDAVPQAPEADDSLYDDRVEATTAAVQASRARLREISAANGFRALLSGFVGFGAAQSSFGDLTSSGSFGVYGLRLHLSYPLFRGAADTASVEARVELRRAEAARDEAVEGARLRYAEYRLREQSAAQRVELLRRSLEAANSRQDALDRLVAAGLRTPSDVAQARADRLRRELALLAAEVERWKTAHLMARMGPP